MVLLNPNRAERLANELHVLNEVAKALVSPLPLPELLNNVLQRISVVLPPAEVGTVMLWDEDAGLFRSAAAFGFNPEIFKQLGLRAGESITGKVFDQNQVCLWCNQEEIMHAMADVRPANRTILQLSLGTTELPVCILAAPLIVGQRKYGVLVLETFHGQVVFSERDIPFVKFLADLIALAIDRAFLEERADEIRQDLESDRLRSEILATLSHELRMPLTAIKGYSSALMLTEIQWSHEKQREFLRLIEEACDNMDVMLRQILDSSLIDVRQITIECQPVRLPLMMRDVTAETQLRTDIHQILVDFPAEFPLVNVDPHWIRQVFRNIIDNAIKYSPDGGLIVIRGEVRATDVVISVSDQGIGISPENLIPLFEKYFRVRPPSGYHVPGAGLGLPITRAIVEMHGGRIWVESKVGQGTTLYFSLPKARPPIADV